MAFSEHSADLDTGISYNESSNAIQRLLDKLRKSPRQGGMMNVLGRDKSDQSSNISYANLSAKLDALIELTEYNPKVIESVWRRLKKPSPSTIKRITMPKKEFKEEHERLAKVLKQKDPAALNRERLKQAKEMKERGLSAVLDDLIQFQGDPRPRNNLGEFRPQDEGGPDPNAMVKTYRIAPAQPGMAPDKRPGLLGLGGLALVGGAAGGFGGQFGTHLGTEALKKIQKVMARFKK